VNGAGVGTKLAKAIFMKNLTSSLWSLVAASASASLVIACGGSVADPSPSPESEPVLTAAADQAGDSEEEVSAPTMTPRAGSVADPSSDTAPMASPLDRCRNLFEQKDANGSLQLPKGIVTTACAKDSYSACVGDYCTPCAPARCEPGSSTPYEHGFGGKERSDATLCTYQCDKNQWASVVVTYNTPLVLAFDRLPVQFTQASGAFDLAGKSSSIGTDWVSARTPWLALDRNNNGSIDDGAELFGSMTQLSTGVRARQGFEALADLDENRDGVIDSQDTSYAQLLLWSDHNQDRVSQPNELQHLAEAGVESLSLAHSARPTCTAMNCEGERSSLTFRTAAGKQQGTLIDVYLSSH
jgi:hypothetical protein